MIPCPHCGFPVNVVVEQKAHRCHCSHCHATMLIYIITIRKPDVEKISKPNKAKQDTMKVTIQITEPFK